MLKDLLKLILGKGVFKSYSQFGEDAILNAIFRNKNKGRYVDIGSYKPIQYSNTYALYRRGWNGICVDPNDFSAEYTIFRPRDTFIHAAVGEGAITYYLHKDGAYNGFQHNPESPLLQKKEMTLRPLKEIITAPTDFLNIDCEGLDLKILESHDWKIRPTVIAVEGDAHSFLQEKGYELIGLAGITKIYRLMEPQI